MPIERVATVHFPEKTRQPSTGNFLLKRLGKRSASEEIKGRFPEHIALGQIGGLLAMRNSRESLPNNVFVVQCLSLLTRPKASFAPSVAESPGKFAN